MLRHIKTIKSAFAALFIVAGCLYGCQLNEVVPELPLDHIAIRSGESVVTSAGITVTADSVNVSICPKGSACFAPNSTSARFRLSKNAQSRSVRLWAFIPNYARRQSVNPPADSASVEFDGQRYKVILRDGGYRRGSENTALPEAIIQVSRL